MKKIKTLKEIRDAQAKADRDRRIAHLKKKVSDYNRQRSNLSQCLEIR